MLQYTNGVHVSMNETKTEVMVNFLLDSVDFENHRKREPVADLVMSGEMASKLVDLIIKLMDSEPKQK